MATLNSILPIILIIFIAYILKKLNLVRAEIVDGLNSYIYWLAAPAVILDSVTSYDIFDSQLSNYWLAYPISVTIGMLAIYIIFKVIFKETNISAINYAFNSTIKNVIIIGYPVLTSILGSAIIVPMIIAILYFNCVFTPILIIFNELHYVHNNKQFLSNSELAKKVFIEVFKNPLTLSAIAGILISSSKLTSPTVLKTSLDYIAPSFSPCALFAIGVTLSFEMRQLVSLKNALATLLSLTLFPFITFAVSQLLGMSPLHSIILIIFSALPTAKTMFIYAKKYGINEDETSATITLSTLTNVISFPLIVWLLSIHWPSILK